MSPQHCQTADRYNIWKLSEPEEASSSMDQTTTGFDFHQFQ